MKAHKYLMLRGRKWTIVRKVPADISDYLGKKQVWRSLKTTDIDMANSRYPAALAEIEAEFEIARLNRGAAKPASLDTIDVEWIARTWFEAQNQSLSDNDIGFTSPEEKIERISEVGQERTMWLENHAEANLGQLQSIADGLLRKAGLPGRPLSEAEKKLGRKKPYLANVDKSELKYHHFVQLIRRGLIELCERELELLGVKIDRTPLVNLYRSGTILKPSVKEPSETTLSLKILTDKYLFRFEGEVDGKTYGDKAAALKFLTDYVGENTPIHMLKREHFNELRDKLMHYPTNAKKSNATKDLSFEELINFAKKNNLKCLSVPTIRKRMMVLMSFSKWAAGEEYIEKDVAANLDMMKLKDTILKKNKRDPFSVEQLRCLFASEQYLNPQKPMPSMYWAPLIALFHGMRMEEILQLSVSDIVTDDKTNIKYFCIHADGENKLKNANTARNVPIHPIMEQLGFLNYLKKTKKGKTAKLFPELKRGSDGSFRKPFSARFIRLLKKVDVHTTKTTFHSFRHNFTDVAKNGGVQEAVLNQLAGWNQKSGMQGHYGKGYNLENLYDAMKKVQYPDLDLSHLYS